MDRLTLSRNISRQVSFVLIGLLLVVVGGVMSADFAGIGTKWRNVSMSFYDRRSGPDGYEKNTRRFRFYYRVVTIFGLLLLIGGLLSLA
jgi:hypothetical protein